MTDENSEVSLHHRISPGHNKQDLSLLVHARPEEPQRCIVYRMMKFQRDGKLFDARRLQALRVCGYNSVGCLIEHQVVRQLRGSNKAFMEANLDKDAVTYRSDD